MSQKEARHELACSWCGEDLSGEEAESPYRDSSGDLICDECFRDEYEFTCCLCGNYEHVDSQHDFLVIFEKCGGLGRGVYKITDFPYYTSNYFDMWWNVRNLRKVRGLPWSSKSLDGYPSGHLCLGCRFELGPRQAQASVGDPQRTRPEVILHSKG